jgi:hypothetical protein
MRNSLLPGAIAAIALGCSDGGGVGPISGGNGAALATQFERLADSVDQGGYSPAGEALRHAAEIVRLTGHASPVSLTIDDEARNFLAVAEQIDFPNLECSWPSDSGIVAPGDSLTVLADSAMTPPGGGGGEPPGGSGNEPPTAPDCKVVGTFSMRTLIAWEPERMTEVARIVADIGSNQAAPGVPDVMTGLPANPGVDSAPTPSPGMTPADSGSGGGGEPPGFPGFFGEYLVRDVGSWFAVEGSQTNDLVSSGESCTDDHAAFDWAQFTCEGAQFRFEFQMNVEPLRYEPLTGGAAVPDGPTGRHSLSLGSSLVDGVRLTWNSWTPPPLPVPVDSGTVKPD